MPTDWTIAINYVGGGLSTPKGVAVDASGNVWLPNYGNSSVTKLSNTGAAVSGSSGFTVGSLNLPVAIAVDTGGNAWVANSSTVTEISPSGSTGTLYSGGSLSAPKSVAVDGAGDIWVANGGGSSVTEITTGGSLVNYTGAGVASPVAIAISPK
jgi:streptogramin lyase